MGRRYFSGRRNEKPLFGDIKADLRREGKLIDDFDILIVPLSLIIE
jgi:hypothetical protein